MSVPIPASEIAAGDYAETFGTVKIVKEHRHPKTNVLHSIDLTFWNGRVEIGVEPDSMFIITQGGLLDRDPSSTFRPGLTPHKF